ncbi:TEN1-like protein [Mya arenaria]|uniref:TEN1-like protein n=1 Tax=Mya arenaria TaxID=6604 RepID=A0ABY7F734_MYAAR|nr:TEN1-like protein [Mya arenaria]
MEQHDNCVYDILNHDWKECIAGYYGDHCNVKCLNGCVHEVCIRNGTCLECIDGYYGDRCNAKCSQGCADGNCIRDGLCTKCISDFYGENCNISCKQGAFFRNNTYNCIDNIAGFGTHETETDGRSAGLVVGATFIGLVAGLIISLVGEYIWKQHMEIKKIDMATSTGDNINGDLTVSTEQDYERLVQDQRRNSLELTAYDMCETTSVQHGPSEDAHNESNEDNHN